MYIVYFWDGGVYHHEAQGCICHHVCMLLSDWPWHQCCPLHCQFVQQFAELWIFPSPEKISLGYIGSLISTNRHNFQTNLCQTRRFGDLWSTSLVNCIVCHISAPTASFRTCKKEPMKVTDDQKNDITTMKGNDDDDVKEWDGERCTGCRATAVSASICKSHSTASCTEANLQCNCVHPTSEHTI